MNREKSLFKNTLVLGLGTILPKLSSLITLPLITANLNKTEYGTYELINTMAILFLPIATLKIETAAFRYLIEVKDNKKEQKIIISTILSFVTIICIVALLVLFSFLRNIRVEIRVLICIFFFIDTIISVTRQVARGLLKNKIYSSSAMINSVLNLILIVVFVSWKRFGLTGILIASIIPLIASWIYLILTCKIYLYIDFKLVDMMVLKQLISYSLPMVSTSMSSWIMNLSDRIIVSCILGVEANAIYAISNKLPSLFTMMQGTFSLAWQENASISNKDEDVEVYYNNMFRNIFSILCGLMAILMAATPIIFKILVHGNYGEAYRQVPILYMGVFFASLSSFFAGIYIANKTTKRIAVSTFIAALINLIINLIFIGKIKLYAASMSTLISYFILTVYRMYDIRKLQKLSYDYIRILYGILILGIMSFICVENNFYFNIVNIIIGIVFTYTMNKELTNIISKKIYIKLKNKKISLGKI